MITHMQVELFRELQMLSTDYLRQRALYTLQDLVTRYLTEEAVTSEVDAAMEKVHIHTLWCHFLPTKLVN